jgi:hypothetical protein
MEWQYPHLVISFVCGRLTFTLSLEGFISLLHLHLTCNYFANTISHVFVIHKIWKFTGWWDESKCCGDHNDDKMIFATSFKLIITWRGVELAHMFWEVLHRPPRSSIRSTSEHYAPRCCKLNWWKRFMMTKELFTTNVGSGVIKGVECCSSKCNHWWNID